MIFLKCRNPGQKKLIVFHAKKRSAYPVAMTFPPISQSMVATSASVRKATAFQPISRFLNLRYIPAARLYHVNSKWRSQRAEGFPLGLTSGDWRTSMPGPNDNVREKYRLVKLFTSNVADALYIEPVAALGLKADGVITLEHAIKRAIETVFQVEPNEIGVVTLGVAEAPNILIYEAAEGSLGILSQFVEGTRCIPAGYRSCKT